MNYNVNSKFNKNAKFKIQNSNKIDEQIKKKQIKSMLQKTKKNNATQDNRREREKKK